MAFCIELPIRSMPQPRPRLARGRVHYPRTFEVYRRKTLALLRSAWHALGRPWVDPPIGVILEFGGPKRGDIDNHVKAWLDLLGQAFLWDDRHVYEVAARWREVDEPGVRIVIYGTGDQNRRREEVSCWLCGRPPSVSA
jgi:Holliday junction resolvase RusA-like endonuclease